MTDIVYNKNGIPFDIDAIATDLNGKMDKDGINATASVCVESYQNSSSWYRVYSDGWCEQGGKVFINAQSSTTVSFLKPFKSSDYIALTADNYNGSGAMGNISIYTLSTTQLNIWNSNGSSRTGISWQASGYIR